MKNKYTHTVDVELPGFTENDQTIFDVAGRDSDYSGCMMSANGGREHGWECVGSKEATSLAKKLRAGLKDLNASVTVTTCRS